MCNAHWGVCAACFVAASEDGEPSFSPTVRAYWGMRVGRGDQLLVKMSQTAMMCAIKTVSDEISRQWRQFCGR